MGQKNEAAQSTESLDRVLQSVRLSELASSIVLRTTSVRQGAELSARASQTGRGEAAGTGQTLVDLASEGERLDGEIAVNAARKKELTDFFQVDALADVRQALERCRKRAELVEQQGKLERQIIGGVQLPSLEVAMASLADVVLTELQREQAELMTRFEGLDARSKNLFADRARATDRLNAVGGDDAAARLGRIGAHCFWKSRS